jgi:hypothetical protein
VSIFIVFSYNDVLHQLVFLTERTHIDFLRGETFSDDEAIVIRQCATELLQTIPGPSPLSDEDTLLLPFVFDVPTSKGETDHFNLRARSSNRY